MYLNDFDLQDFPFIQSARREFYFLTEENRRNAKIVQHWLDAGSGILRIEGESGTGRTALLQHVVSQSELNINSVILNVNALQELDLLRFLAVELAISANRTLPGGDRTLDRAQIRSAVRSALRSASGIHQRTLLILQNADDLSDQALWSLQDLSTDLNYFLPLMHVAATGAVQSGKAKSRKQSQSTLPIHATLAIKRFTASNTTGFIQHRLALVSNTAAGLFPATVCREIHKLANGNPYRINQLCDKLLYLTAEAGKQNPDLTTVKAAVAELGWTSTTPSRRKVTARANKPVNVSGSANMGKRSAKKSARKSATGISRSARTVRGSTSEKSTFVRSALSTGVKRRKKAKASVQRRTAARVDSGFRLNQDVNVIGRASDCAVRIDDPAIGPYQVLIIRSPDGLIVRNEDAHSPLLVNNQAVDHALLANGDRLQIADHQFDIDTTNGQEPLLVAVAS